MQHILAGNMDVWVIFFLVLFFCFFTFINVINGSLFLCYTGRMAIIETC